MVAYKLKRISHVLMASLLLVGAVITDDLNLLFRLMLYTLSVGALILEVLSYNVTISVSDVIQALIRLKSELYYNGEYKESDQIKSAITFLEKYEKLNDDKSEK